MFGGMDDEELDRYFENKEKSEKHTEEVLKSLEGKTIKSVHIEQSGREYYAEIKLECTDGTKISIQSKQGETVCFTDLSADVTEEEYDRDEDK